MGTVQKMKKFFILFVMLFALCGCAAEPVNILYVAPADSPVTSPSIDLVDSDNAAKLKELGISFNAQDIASLDYDVNVLDLKDSNGNAVDLSGITVIEAVATWCSYCANQITTNNPAIRSRHPEVTLIEAFVSQEIDLESYFEGLGVDYDKSILYLTEGEDTLKLQEELGIEYFPTFVFMKDGVVKLMFSGECDIDLFGKILAYMESPVDNVFLGDSDLRTADDVEKDLGEEKAAMLEDLENRGNYATKDVTLKNIGREVHIKENDTIDKAVICVSSYVFEDFVYEVNSYKEKNSDTDVYMMLADGDKDQIGSIRESLREDIELFDYLSVPDDIYNLEGAVLPTVFYIENNTVVGALSAPVDEQEMIYASGIFFGEDSIARLN